MPHLCLQKGSGADVTGLPEGPLPWDSEDFLRPVLQDDPLLQTGRSGGLLKGEKGVELCMVQSGYAGVKGGLTPCQRLCSKHPVDC